MKKITTIFCLLLITSITSCKKSNENTFSITNPLDAYQIYVQNGGTLTYEDWLIEVGYNSNDINNEQFDPPYEVFLATHPGYTGDEETWLNENHEYINKTPTNTQIKNIIYVIGDGMGINSLRGGELYSNKHFSFTRWESYLCNTNSLNSLNKPEKTTDSAAGGTALATGTLTYNQYVGLDKDGNELKTVLDVAKEQGKRIGVVTTDKPYGATPGAFSAHSISRNNTEEIMKSQANSSNLDLLIGCYSGTYDTNKNDFINNGFTYSTNLDNNLLKNDRLFINNKDMIPYEGDNSLLDSAKYAVDYLNNDNGFTLMIEQAHIDKNSHNNDFEMMAKCAVELSATIDYLVDYFKDSDDTLILITADHETGGLSVSKDQKLKNKYESDVSSFYYAYSTTGHTDTYVPLYMNKKVLNLSPLKENEPRLIKNTEIAKQLNNLLTK